MLRQTVCVPSHLGWQRHMMEVLLWFTKDTDKHPCPFGCQAGSHVWQHNWGETRTSNHKSHQMWKLGCWCPPWKHTLGWQRHMMEVLVWFTKETDKHLCPVRCQAAFCLWQHNWGETRTSNHISHQMWKLGWWHPPWKHTLGWGRHMMEVLLWCLLPGWLSASHPDVYCVKECHWDEWLLAILCHQLARTLFASLNASHPNVNCVKKWHWDEWLIAGWVTNSY